MPWEFEKYGKDSTKQNPSSEKFFRGQSELVGLVREAVQNSLDAVKDGKRPIRVVFSEKDIPKSLCGCLELNDLNSHLKECDISVDLKKDIHFIVVEDFNTRGLEGNNFEDFFYCDNITQKTTGGGSHGIGKAVFPVFSKIRTFFGYSILGRDENIFQGRSILRSHKINGIEYRPYGDLKIKQYGDKLINEIFKRKRGERGLSIAIPYANSIAKGEIEESFLAQCYLPILDKKLEIEVNGKKFNREKIVTGDVSEKVKMMVECLKGKFKINSTIKKTHWLKNGLPPNLLGKIKELNERGDDFLCQAELKVELPKGVLGKMTVFIKKDPKGKRNEKVDFWRDNLLITNAGRKKLPQGFIAIVLIRDKKLAPVLRNLEDPGHVNWDVGTIPDDIKNKYGNKTDIKKLVQYIKNIPHELAKGINYRPQNFNTNFFSSYFPRKTGKTGSSSSQGEGGKKTEGEEIFPGPQFQNFNYRSSSKGDGFCLTLKAEEERPKEMTVVMAYGTNIGNAFKNYDINDFTLEKNVERYCENCNILEQGDNWVRCEILNDNFKICFLGFDPVRELKIEIRDEK